MMKFLWKFTVVLLVFAGTKADLFGQASPPAPSTVSPSASSATPQRNDFNVTLASARMYGFTELASLKRNHTTVGSGQTGQLVLTQIRQVEAGLP